MAFWVWFWRTWLGCRVLTSIPSQTFKWTWMWARRRCSTVCPTSLMILWLNGTQIPAARFLKLVEKPSPKSGFWYSSILKPVVSLKWLMSSFFLGGKSPQFTCWWQIGKDASWGYNANKACWGRRWFKHFLSAGHKLLKWTPCYFKNPW